MLRKNPAFSATALLTLALGMGAATAIFNVADEALLSPLPLPQPQQLVAIYNFDKHTSRYVSARIPTTKISASATIPSSISPPMSGFL